MKGEIGENANAFKRFPNAFERVLGFPYPPFHQEGQIYSGKMKAKNLDKTSFIRQ